jgi:hypothetical protein
MDIRVTREQGVRLDEALEALLGVEPYLAYANFPPIARREGAALSLHRRRWRNAANTAGVFVARDAHERPMAAVALARREFESQHLGLTIAGAEAPAAVPEEHQRLAALRRLYHAALEALHAEGFQHLTAVSSTQDRAACWVLQEMGGFHVGTKISWMQELTGRDQKHDLPSSLRIEMYDRAQIPTLDPASWRRLYEWSGKAFDRGPFVFDLNVPYDRAMGIYQVWTHKALAGEWADVLLVVRDGGEIVAFHSMMRLQDLSEAAGVCIVGRGIGGTLPGYRGLFTALQKQCSAVRPLGASYLENETQTATIQAINVFGKLGHHCLRSIATFHMPLDRRGSGGQSGAATAQQKPERLR